MSLTKHQEQLIDNAAQAMRGWDEVKYTDECGHCNKTGKAPGDGKTACGFCEPRPKGKK